MPIAFLNALQQKLETARRLRLLSVHGAASDDKGRTPNAAFSILLDSR